MRRREFIALVSGAAAWPVCAQVQQALHSHRIVIVGLSLPSDMNEKGNPGYPELFAELRRLGYIEGHNLIVERYSAWGLKDPVSELAASVARQKPDLILAGTARLVRALKLATTAIPIVGVMTDPVAWGIVESLSRPGGNITGVNFDAGIEIYGKQLELLKELLPQSSVGYLTSRGLWEGGHPADAAVREAAQHLGISLFGAILESAQEAEYRRIFAEKGVAGILVSVHSENLIRRKLVVELATASRLPTLYPYREYVELGGLISYGSSIAEFYRRAAGQIDQILQGGKPGDMPIQQSNKFELVINLKTAKALGITVPPTLLARADEVIE
jgi:putative tryptophan/tyrosine transport system substrate-binding protein